MHAGDMLPLTPPGSDLLMPDLPESSQVVHPAACCCSAHIGVPNATMSLSALLSLGQDPCCL